MAALAIDGQRRLFIGATNAILVYDANGTFIDTFKVDNPAFGLVINDQGEIVVAARTQIYKYLPNKE